MIELRTEDEVIAYYRARAQIQWGGFIIALGALVVLAFLAVEDKPLWAIGLQSIVFVGATLLSTGWVPKRLRAVVPRDEG